MRTLVPVPCLLLLVSACAGDPLGAPAVSAPERGLSASAQPGDAVRDGTGRTQFIVELAPSAAKRYDEHLAPDPRFPSFQRGDVGQVIRAIEREHGIEATSMTSLTGQSFTAYLEPGQVEALRADARVTDVRVDRYLTLSADPGSIWRDQTESGGEVRPWGRDAVNLGMIQSKQAQRRVYVVDTGVALHPDLNVVARVNATSPGSTLPGHLVGCYPHATHVAGIIGALVNGQGTQGINPGAPIVSVSVLPVSSYDESRQCVAGGFSETTVGLALDWVMNDIRVQGRVGVVNLSANGPAFGAGGGIPQRLRVLATPGPNYPGAFVAQAAGNNHENACHAAYPTPSPTDGIMVAGAINDHGQQVVPLNGVNGIRNGDLAGSGPGSSFGACVDTWAPGSLIYSTWSGGGYALLSGTSMAAPHVAGLASFLADRDGLSSGAEIEENLAKTQYALGSVATGGAPIRMASLRPRSPASSPYAEVFIGSPEIGVPGGDFLVYADRLPFGLALDSRGAAAGCDVRRALLPTGAPQSVLTAVAGLFPQTWGLGTWRMSSSTCPSIGGTMTIRPAPTAHWFVNGVERTGQSLTLPADTTAVFSYQGDAPVVGCDLVVGIKDGFSPGYIPVQILPEHGPQDPDVTLLRTPDEYEYRVTCRDAFGEEREAFVRLLLTAVVEPPVNRAEFVSQTVPASLTAGASFPVSIRMRNTGTTTWTSATNHRLGSQNPHDNTLWGAGRLFLEGGDRWARARRESSAEP
jgi:subtilisin family serine protease